MGRGRAGVPTGLAAGTEQRTAAARPARSPGTMRVVAGRFEYGGHGSDAGRGWQVIRRPWLDPAPVTLTSWCGSGRAGDLAARNFRGLFISQLRSLQAVTSQSQILKTVTS